MSPPRLRPRRRWPALAAGLLWALAASDPAAAQAVARHELEAAFVYNFTKFVEWPAESFSPSDPRFHVCLVGEDPFGGVLDQLVEGETVKGRPIVVTRHRRARDARWCQILVLPGSEAPESLAAVPGVREGLVLTVGSSEEFLAAGGLVRFRVRGGRLRLEVNDPARERSRLRMSSKLLQLSDLVDPVSRSGF